MYQFKEEPWQLRTEDELFELLNTRQEGLSKEEVHDRQKKHGLNQMTPQKSQGYLVRYFILLVGGFQLMLWAGAVLSFIVFFL